MQPEVPATTDELTPFAAYCAGGLSEVDELRSMCQRQERLIDMLTSAVTSLRCEHTALKAETAALRAENERFRDVGEQVEARLPLDALAPGGARILAAQYLRDRVEAPVLDSVLLLLSELVTNSVRHSNAPSAEGVMVRLQLTRAMLRLEVEDSGHDGVIAIRPPDQQTGGGFGLNIVQTLSDCWGIERSAHRGTRVWAQLQRTPFTAPPS
jgi:anti-sigma regulatory factor (Ser/Thr protein kinase)